ncbi:LCP family protein [Cellulomonas sp. PhB143]|uniref:LCP family protein n=1 Tax=Cellulomonas sp. PhB143 TaxID=2485186 RepID=UPI000F469A04|nr:LCP family protein [Cellulomonas sp. PhB143]ROS78580.1 LytR family transcriptional attenuator [Cellulomonas sp. PhB143]
MTTDDRSGGGGAPRSVPPSFTPPSGGSNRPRSTDDAIAVGPQGGSGSRPVVPRPPSPSGDRGSGPSRIVRQSTRSTGEQKVDRPAQAGARPTSYPPAGAGASAEPEPTRVPRRASSTPHSSAAQGQPRTAAAPPPGGRQGSAAQGSAPQGPSRPSGGSTVRIRKGRVVALVLVLVVILLLAWPVGLIIWANSKIQHVDALSGAKDTSGTTYLLAGSDERDGTVSEDGTSGARTDSILLLQQPKDGPASLISLPRDTYVDDIPGHGPGKLNAAFSYGGAPLLVQTVEQLTGMTVDHYVEVGFAGVEELVDAVGGVELCLDYDVDDEKSGLQWESGCHMADGETALAFSRMRYSDPKGDIGRAERQRQVIGAIADAAITPSLLWHPGTQVDLITAGTDAVSVDEDAGLVDLGRLALTFNRASGPDGVTGTPPISDPDYRPGGVGSTVLLDPDKAPQFFEDVMNGDLKAGSTVGGLN